MKQQHLIDPPAAALDTESTDERYTPPEILEAVAEFWPEGITLDPCWSPLSLVKAKTTYTIEDDGLSRPWEGRVWVNPPFSDPAPWLDKICDTCARDDSVQILLLCPNDPTRAWWEYVWTASALCFLRRRTRFLKPNEGRMGSPEFGCVIAYWGGFVPCELSYVFRELGKVVQL